MTYAYDALNRVTSVKDRRGNTQFFTYDATDRIVQVKDRNGKIMYNKLRKLENA